MIRDGIKRLGMLGCSLFFSSMVYAYPSLDGIQFYPSTTHLSYEHKQKLADDINRYHNAEDLWGVLRSEFVLNHYEDDPAVQEQINWFMNHQDFLLRSTNRAAPYLYYILQQARLRHLPAELVLLPIFESAYNPYAYSPQGASGIWQMMPGTASGYGIKQDWWYDGRRDVITSTKAALNYLSYLKNFFDGNWILAIAAYDSGEGSVRNAVNKNIREGKSTGFFSLPLPQETHIYVPRLLALAAIIANPDRYPVYLPPVRNAPYLAQMDLNSQMDLKHAANLAGMNLKDLLALNPGYNRPTMSPKGPYKLVLPIENVEQFTENFASLPANDRTTWQRYIMRSGDTLAKLAARHNTTTDQLRQMNQLATYHVAPGKSVLVPRTVPAISKTIMEAEEERYFKDNHDALAAHNPKKKTYLGIAKAGVHLARRVTNRVESALIPNTAATRRGNYVIQPGDTIYMARGGDTMERVAKHFHLSVQSLQAANPVGNRKILSSGEKLVIPTHLKQTQVAKVGAATKYQVTPGDTVYVVRRGDTMEKIAQRFHTTAPEIRVANLLASNAPLKDGDNLVIPAPL